jgi:hypothetical protein
MPSPNFWSALDTDTFDVSTEPSTPIESTTGKEYPPKMMRKMALAFEVPSETDTTTTDTTTTDTTTTDPGSGSETGSSSKAAKEAESTHDEASEDAENALAQAVQKKAKKAAKKLKQKIKAGKIAPEEVGRGNGVVAQGGKDTLGGASCAQSGTAANHCQVQSGSAEDPLPADHDIPLVSDLGDAEAAADIEELAELNKTTADGQNGLVGNGTAASTSVQSGNGTVVQRKNAAANRRKRGSKKKVRAAKMRAELEADQRKWMMVLDGVVVACLILWGLYEYFRR